MSIVLKTILVRCEYSTTANKLKFEIGFYWYYILLGIRKIGHQIQGASTYLPTSHIDPYECEHGTSFHWPSVFKVAQSSLLPWSFGSPKQENHPILFIFIQGSLLLWELEKIVLNEIHTKAELLQLNSTHFSSLGIFIGKKVGNRKN